MKAPIQTLSVAVLLSLSAAVAMAQEAAEVEKPAAAAVAQPAATSTSEVSQPGVKADAEAAEAAKPAAPAKKMIKYKDQYGTVQEMTEEQYAALTRSTRLMTGALGLVKGTQDVLHATFGEPSNVPNPGTARATQGAVISNASNATASTTAAPSKSMVGSVMSLFGR